MCSVGKWQHVALLGTSRVVVVCEAALNQRVTVKNRGDFQSSLQIVDLLIPTPLLKFLRTPRLCSCHLATFRSAVSTQKQPAVGFACDLWPLYLNSLAAAVWSVGYTSSGSSCFCWLCWKCCWCWITVIALLEQYQQLLNTEPFLKVRDVLGI